MSSNSKITVDVTQVLTLGKDFRAAANIGVRQVTERGEQLVREEVPKITRNLAQGVSHDFKQRGEMLQGEVIVTARSGRLARRKATLHLPSGKTKQVTLRAVPAHNYAEDVAKGTGEFGPRKTRITPKKSRALLIPVTSVPSLDGKPEAYIVSGDQTFIVRRSMKGRKPNPYDERAAKRLDHEAQGIFDGVLERALEGTL